MGSLFSKYTESDNEPVEISLEIDHEETAPISTPNRLDPRSPSTNIARTPLELILYQKPHLKETPIGKNCVMFGVDPRSPTADFQRTPIIVADNTMNEQHGKLYNKNLENVRKLLIDDEIEPTTQEKSGENNPIMGNNKRKSMAGVLETNVDFTETNIDDVLQKKLKQGKCVEESINKDQDNDHSHEESYSFNIAAHIRDFSKKLTTLIYEDKTTSDDNKERIIGKLPKIRENNRTPLSVRCTNREQVKKTAKLKVRDKPKMSRIPVLKNVNYKKIIQCENTPPTTTILLRGDIITQKSKWDKEATLII